MRKRELPARSVYFKTTIGDRLGNPESSETATEIGGNTYGGGAPQGNIKFTISNVSTSARVFLTTPQRTDFAAFFLSPKKKTKTPPLSLYLLVYMCTDMYMHGRVYVCDRFRRICNILFCIENDLGAILRCAFPFNRMQHLPSCTPRVPFVQPRVLPA